MVRRVLQLSLELTELVLLGSQVRLPPVETKLRMEVGGVIRQSLRLGMYVCVWCVCLMGLVCVCVCV